MNEKDLQLTRNNEMQQQLEEEEVPELIEMQDPPRYVEMPVKVPITVITGYLGSGKTTMLNYILTANHGKRIAVILNEYGDSMDIEKNSIKESNADSQVFEEWIELRNGCLCCSVKDAGVKAIENLLKIKGKYDHIIIETTGLANPGPIISMFWIDSELESEICLDGLVTVVDCFHAFERIEEEGEFMAQIIAADRIILNKTDLISSERLFELKKRVQKLNPFASLCDAIKGVVPLEFLFGINEYTEDESLLKCKLEKLDCISITHDSSIVTVPLTLPPMSIDAFERWLEVILWEKVVPNTNKSIDVIRTKALLKTHEGVYYTYQGVYETYDKIQLTHIPENVNPRVVFIGRLLDAVRLQESLNFK